MLQIFAEFLDGSTLLTNEHTWLACVNGHRCFLAAFDGDFTNAAIFNATTDVALNLYVLQKHVAVLATFCEPHTGPGSGDTCAEAVGVNFLTHT